MMTRLPPLPAAHHRLKGLAAYRPYWRGYDQEEDESLAEKLFFGRSVIDAAGREKQEYLVKNSPQERSAREALARVVAYYSGGDGPLVMSLLCCALMNANNAKVQRIDFKSGNKRGGGRSNPYADLQIYHHYRGLKPGRGEGKAAIYNTMQKFGRSRKAVFAAIQRAKKRLSF
jgi:hypothetical protein